jgi:hypothetical protein
MARSAARSAARLRPIKLGKQVIAFRPTAPSKLFWAGRPAMRVVQALHWLRDALTNPDDRRRILRRLRTILADKDQGAAIAADLSEGLPTLPAWMQDLVRQLLADRDDDDRQHDVPIVRRRAAPRRAGPRDGAAATARRPRTRGSEHRGAPA